MIKLAHSGCGSPLQQTEMAFARSLCKLNLVAQKRVVMKTWDEVLFDVRKKLGLKTCVDDLSGKLFPR